MRQFTIRPTFEAWRTAAREALAAGLEPVDVAWETIDSAQPALGMFEEAPARGATRFNIPKPYIELASRVACHHDARRWGLLYRVLWRLTHCEARLLEVAVDPDIHALMLMDKAVRRDVHKMRAFVRFREVRREDGTWYVAWFEPEHHIVARNAPFFIDRFASMRWSILTPDQCAHWDLRELTLTPGVPRSQAPGDDAVEDLWRTYYGHIFNPARVKVEAMTAEMPRRYWKNLPEAAIIPGLLQRAPARAEAMITEAAARHAAVGSDEYGMAEPPPDAAWPALREAALGCKACPLWKNATQTVFGEGPRPAPLMLVGEQPGDSEDRAGHPFIGPAGLLLDRALAEAGIAREAVYVTNAVKHFKWEPRGKRRLHQKPSGRDIAACRPWLVAEMRAVAPRVIVCLGGTAGRAVFGREVKVLAERGRVQASEFSPLTMVTYHPSALLRAPDAEMKARQYAEFLEDLRGAREVMEG